ncbi:MAG: hypothetical protein U0X58_07810 [Flavobacteriaceae bacterium]
MKNIFLSITLLFQLCFLYGQSSKIVFDQLGVKVSYKYQRVGSLTNNQTGTKFGKYIFSSSIQNSSSKYFDVKGYVEYEYMQAMQLVTNDSDKNFIRSNSLQATLDHVFCGQGCSNYPSDGAAHLFVICPNSSSFCEKTFVFPDDEDTSIPIRWGNYSIQELFNDKESNENHTVSASQTQDPKFSEWKSLSGYDCNPNIEYCVKKVVQYKLNYQLWFYYKIRNNNDKQVSLVFYLTRDGKKEFTQSHTINPGGEQEFMHKMSGDYINGVAAENIIFTETKKSICDKSENGQNSNSSSNNLQAAISEFNELLLKTPDSDLKSNIYNSTNKIIQGSSSDQTKLFAVNEGIKKLKNLQQQNTSTNINLADKVNELNRLCSEIGSINSLSAKATAKENCISGATFENTEKDQQVLQTRINNLKNAIEPARAEEERIKNEIKEKQEKFNQYIQEGDSAMSSKKYDSAMNSYSNAKNFAVDSSQTQLADRKYQEAYTAKRNAAREERLEKQKERDQKEDLAYTAAATGMIGAMALVNDRYTHKISSGKLQFGLGYDQTPMITNQNNTYAPLESFSDKASYPTLFLGLKLEFLNNKPININVRGLYSLGIQAFDQGVSGTHVVTGFDGGVQFWYTKHTKFKLFADVGSYTRVGERVQDKDAANSGTTATDDVREGEYNYKVFRFGGGPMFHSRHDGKETWVKAGLFLEKVSFVENAQKTMSFSLSANIESELIIELNYSKNYPVAGTINYPDSFTFENQNYLSIKLIRQGNLW